MNKNYYNKIQEKIDDILQRDSYTFQEIVRECKGAYPVDVLHVLNSKNIFMENKEICIYTKQNKCDIKEFVTRKIENNPILCSWYFSITTCKRIVELYPWTNKKILFLGMPRLFEYFACNVESAYFTLVDLDCYVVERLRKEYANNKNCNILLENINTYDFSFKEKYDFIFLDPPWYMSCYNTWLEKSYKILEEENGMIIFPLFQELTRPNAESERKELISNVEKYTKKCLMLRDFIEYEIPTFEKNELKNCGIEFENPWKKADLIIAPQIVNSQYSSREKRMDFQIEQWDEVDIFNIRFFIKKEEFTENEDVMIRYLSKETPYLKNPSQRNEQLKMANMITSRGQGYIVQSTEGLVYILKGIKKRLEDENNIGVILEAIKMDNLSKKILFEILGGRI